MNPTALCLSAFAALAVSLPLAAQDPDPKALEAELRVMFDRPAGTPISDAQKAKLTAFLARHEGQDLGAFGYANALHRYLERDYEGAFEAADAYFAHHDAVPIPEHATMLGRICMMGMMRGDDVQARARQAERAARLYPDVAMLERVIPRALGGLDSEGQRAIRLAIVRGALAGDHPDSAVDELIRAVYATGGDDGAVRARGAVPATPIRRVPAAPGETEARDRATARRAELTGAAAPALSPHHVIGADEDLTLDSLRGKVVVLDFTATWCSPCRKVIPSMIALQKAHRDDLQVVGVTRLYTYGADFRGDASGGSMRNLDRDTELEVNRAFVDHFELNYPIVLVEESTSREGYGVTGIPTVFVIGKDGKVVGHAVGATDASHAKVEEMVKHALAQ